jgi:hypothetical protein
MNKFLLSSLILLLIIVPIVGIVVILLDQNEPPTNTSVESTTFPPSNGSGLNSDPNSQSDTIEITVDNGEVVTIDNIIKKSEAVSIGESMYSISGESYIEPKQYSLVFNQENNSFAISLDSVPLDVARQQASDDILTLLNISITEACSLNMYVGVSFALDRVFSGQNLGLSYCPDAITL